MNPTILIVLCFQIFPNRKTCMRGRCMKKTLKIIVKRSICLGLNVYLFNLSSLKNPLDKQLYDTWPTWRRSWLPCAPPLLRETTTVNHRVPHQSAAATARLPGHPLHAPLSRLIECRDQGWASENRPRKLMPSLPCTPAGSSMPSTSARRGREGLL